MFFQLADHVGNARGLLTHRDVDTLNAGTLLVDNGVNCHGGFTGLAVTNNQFALTATDRHHRVNGLETNLHRLIHRLTPVYARRYFFNR